MVKPTSGICCEFAQKSCEKLKVFVQKVETKKLFKKVLKFTKSCDIIFGVKGKRLDEQNSVATNATEWRKLRTSQQNFTRVLDVLRW